LVYLAYSDINRIPRPYPSKNFNEIRFILPPDMPEDYGCNVCSLKGVRAEGIGCGIPQVLQKFAILSLDNRRQLQEVADHDQLHPTEQTIIMAQLSKPRVNCVDDIGPHHRNFIDNERSHVLIEYTAPAIPRWKIFCVEYSTRR
jgi:hypothetical protein